MDSFFYVLSIIDRFFWEYIGIAAILLVGTYLSVISKGKQFSILINFKSNLKQLIEEGKKKDKGVNPIKLVFASVGGMIGVGNIVLIGAAVCIGGPGSIFWIWIGSIAGMLIKYSEIYLAIKYRVHNKQGGYDGGVMYYVKEAFGSKFLSLFIAVVLCIYTAEVYQFTILVDRVHHNFNFINKWVLVFILMCLIIYSSIGGMQRLSNICSVIMPIFLLVYLAIGLYIIFSHYSILGDVFREILYSAFNDTAAKGSFMGSTGLLSAYMGISKGVYAGDIGVGYDSVIQSETSAVDPRKQARFAIYSLLSNTLICTVSTMIIAVTGSWYNIYDVAHSDIMGLIINRYIPVFGDYFVTFILFFAGFTTVIASIAIGIKSAKFISEKFGSKLYLAYVVFALPFFSSIQQDNVALIVSLSSGIILFINLLSIVKLYKKIEF